MTALHSLFHAFSFLDALLPLANITGALDKPGLYLIPSVFTCYPLERIRLVSFP